MRTMRAKMRINSIEKFENGEALKMSAVCANSYSEDGADENNTYAKYTPSADLTMHITNPDLAGSFSPGQVFYVDFIEAE